MQFFEIYHLLLSFLPAWVEIALALSLSALLVIAVFRLVAFVMDILPFV